ncbi:MAG: LacI family DNA-binding transcriptional regulator [Candidatus Omnitrophica bacterium]|nr:LacI family DNA-binding transcriptional regulator [Candidatus Omnitrophota bacterium]MDD5611012.1 LacI family DNA-binding transcriptional regulator [Candidatus Omnitrophota bacterium]
MVRTKSNSSQSISINEVAKMAGVSITTVSRVINKFPSVKDKNRQKVLEVIKKLKYNPSPLAQRLATGKTNVISLVMPRYEGIFYSFYALELIKSIGNMCGVLKLDLLLRLSDSYAALDLRDIGGLIFADIIGNKAQLQQALEAKIPTVVINNYVQDLEVNCLAVDNLAGAKEATKYLIGLGHRRIAHIAGDLVTQAAAQRLEGYKQALKENKLAVDESYIKITDYSRGKARTAANELLSLDPAPTAIFAASDTMALEVMAVAMEKNKQLPQDLSIVGFDDNPASLYGPLALTTVRQPLIKMGEEAVKRLNALMSGKEKGVVKTLLPAELVIRDSCARISGG